MLLNRMNNFITNNSEKNLKRRINRLILDSKELKFLVGFFYFSGLKELYEGIKQNSNLLIKILVGLYVDKTNYGIIEYAEKSNISFEEKINLLINSIKKSINTELFDNKDFYEQAHFFIKLIEENRLIIRKTDKPNHAKLYIFKLKDNSIKDAIFITGSSNLTQAGLTEQQEFNVEISDYGTQEAEEYFNNLWENAIKLTEDNITKRKIIQTIENETLIKKLTPFEAYTLVLKNYIETYTPKDTQDEMIKYILEKNGFKPYRYQIDAVKQALNIIEKTNGVIIADVVGLGKTIIACLIAKLLNKRGIILCPPGIIGDEKIERSGWKWYKETFELYAWIVESIGNLDNPEFVKSLKKLKNLEVIIVDEAHRFRNQDTKSYENLKNLCRDKIVILLTATPFNNKPSDILSLLKLFILPKKSIITLESNLEYKFNRFQDQLERLAYIEKYYKDPQKLESVKQKYKALFKTEDIDLKKVSYRIKYISKQIRDIIEPVIIRRNRLDLLKNPFYKDEINDLTKVADPQEWFFELTPEQLNFYEDVINYFRYPNEGGLFKGAIYRPFHYETDSKDFEDIEYNNSENLVNENRRHYQQQFNLYDLMRRLLVKRFESSFGAFKKSIENFKNITEKCLEFIQKTNKFILDRELLEKIYTKDIEEIEKELLKYSQKISQGEYPKNHKVYDINKFHKKDQFINDIKSDIKLFEHILNKLKELDLVNNDPKLKCLIDKIKELRKKEPTKKIVIFSEYLDTVNYLKDPLLKSFDNKVLVVLNDIKKTMLKEINSNFDASYPKEKQANDYDILLCTDKLSEGFNLNRAGIVINYDIPWNPVRVIQRVGRINRIGKKVFDEIYIANFFPTEKGAELVKSREIASQKMFLIHNTLGEDSKIFDPDEEPTPSNLYLKINQNPDNIESESFYTKILNEFQEIKTKYPEVIENIKDCPLRVKVAKKSDKDELLVFIRKAKLYIKKVDYSKDDEKDYEKNSEIQEVTLEEIIDRIRCNFDEKTVELSNEFWDYYEEIKNSIEKDFNKKRLNNSDLSLEQKARNKIMTLLKFDLEQLKEYRNFLKTLLEDLTDYGTLPYYTLRRIANLEIPENENKIQEIITKLEELKDELGENYLLKEIEKFKNIQKEIIIAIENRNI